MTTAFFAALWIALASTLAAQSTDALTPPHRRHHAIAYDPATTRVLVYGGQHLVSNSDAPMLDDLWAWDGRAWTKVAGSTGIGMLAHKLFADGTGGVFAHGGFGGITARWNDKSWSIIAADVNSQREAAAGAYDVDRKRFVLFGGHVGGRSLPRETWEFDGQRWEHLPVDGPGPMLGGAMAYDVRRHVMVLFGGLDSAGRKLGDTWQWDGAKWARVATNGPPPRFGAGIAFDTRRGEIVLFGGVDADNRKLGDTWLWNGQTWRAVSASPTPPARSEGYLAYDQARGVTVMFGGEGTQTVPSLGDTWEWDGAQWRRRM